MRIDPDAPPTTPARFSAATRAPTALAIGAGVRARIVDARRVVDDLAEGDVPVYGLNTGLGGNLGHRLAPTELAAFQDQILDGRAVAVGPDLPHDTGLGVTLARLMSAARGVSGMSPAVFDHLAATFEAGIAPAVPEYGSIGAGDLVQAACWARGLLGRGRVFVDGQGMDGAAALAAAGLRAPLLGPRDAMALINHSGVTVALSASALDRARAVFVAARATAALACEGYGANALVFAPEVDANRAAPGQAAAAAWFAAALDGAENAPRRIQEALSFRTLAPVFGAADHALAHAEAVWADEARGSSDSPVVTSDGRMVSTANFQSPALALALESVSLALAMLGHGSVQRVQKLMDPALSGLPRYLSPVGGASAGMMPMQKTAMALLASVRHAALPVAFDPPPVSDTVEDMAPQTPAAAQKLDRQTAALSLLVAIEALAAAQALDLRAPRRRSRHGAALHRAIRDRAAMLTDDRPLGPDIEAVAGVLDRWATCRGGEGPAA